MEVKACANFLVLFFSYALLSVAFLARVTRGDFQLHGQNSKVPLISFVF